MTNKTIDEVYAIAADVARYGHSGICRHLPRMVDLVNSAIKTSDRCRIVELGIGGGDQSTVAWLYALKSLGARGELHCYDVNEPITLPELRRLAAEQGTKFTFTKGSTLTATPKPCEILFVDTLHTKEQVARELNIFASNVTQYIAFHDTEAFRRHGQFLPASANNTGVLDAIEAFVSKNTEYGLLKHYLDDNGFLVLSKTQFLPNRRINAINSNIGVVIGTFAAVPYVHLSLAALRHHEPNIKIAVHDDCSSRTAELTAICQQYSADFYTLEYRRKATVGDLAATAYAARWSASQKCDIGVKLSRRFIINRPFTEELRYLFHNMQRPTVCGADATFSFGYRSEAVAMWTPAWIESGVVHEMEQLAAKNETYHALPEAWYHDRAKFVDAAWRTTTRCKYENAYPLAHSRASFTDWPLLGLGRDKRVPGVLWHDSHGPADYAALALELNLPYTLADFKDPNMGLGARPTT